MGQRVVHPGCVPVAPPPPPCSGAICFAVPPSLLVKFVAQPLQHHPTPSLTPHAHGATYGCVGNVWHCGVSGPQRCTVGDGESRNRGGRSTMGAMVGWWIGGGSAHGWNSWDGDGDGDNKGRKWKGKGQTRGGGGRTIADSPPFSSQFQGSGGGLGGGGSGAG